MCTCTYKHTHSHTHTPAHTHKHTENSRRQRMSYADNMEDKQWQRCQQLILRTGTIYSKSTAAKVEVYTSRACASISLFVSPLTNIPAANKCISGTDLFGKFMCCNNETEVADRTSISAKYSNTLKLQQKIQTHIVILLTISSESFCVWWQLWVVTNRNLYSVMVVVSMSRKKNSVAFYESHQTIHWAVRNIM